MLAFHGFEVEVIEGDSSAGDEFVFVEAFAVDDEGGFYEFFSESRTLVFGDGGPGGFFGDFRGLAHAVPEAFGDAVDEAALFDFPGAVCFSAFFEDGGDGFGVFVGGPVDFDFEAVVELGEVAGAPGGGF